MFGLFEKDEAVAERKNVDVYDDTMKELDSLLNDTMKVSGVSLSDMIDGLDEESGAMLGRLCTSYKKIVKLGREQAGIIDSMNDKIDKLTALNDRMSQQIVNLTDLVKKSAKEK